MDTKFFKFKNAPPPETASSDMVKNKGVRNLNQALRQFGEHLEKNLTRKDIRPILPYGTRLWDIINFISIIIVLALVIFLNISFISIKAKWINANSVSVISQESSETAQTTLIPYSLSEIIPHQTPALAIPPAPTTGENTHTVEITPTDKPLVTRAEYSGKCMCPHDLDKAGRLCGKRSAYFKNPDIQYACDP